MWIDGELARNGQELMFNTIHVVEGQLVFFVVDACEEEDLRAS